MSQEKSKDFYELLNNFIDKQSYELELTNKMLVKCKQLTTAQLKECIKTVVDSPLTQAIFTTVTTKIFNESVALPEEYSPTILDRLLFLIQTRINAISPTMQVNIEEGTIVANFDQVKSSLIDALNKNSELFTEQQTTDGKFSITYGVPLLSTETQLNEELYKDFVVNTDDPEDVRKMLGEAFVNEIAKSFRNIQIEDQTLQLSTVNFKTRLQIIESLPSALIQKVIDYVENYKKIIDQALTIEGYSIPIDGSLFSVR